MLLCLFVISVEIGSHVCTHEATIHIDVDQKSWTLHSLHQIGKIHVAMIIYTTIAGMYYGIYRYIHTQSWREN